MEKHSILLPNGSTLSSGTEGASIGSVKLTKTVSSGTEIAPGSVCAALLELELMDTGVCPLQAGEEFTLLRDDKQVGIFTVETPKRVGATRFHITAYDRIVKLDQNLDSWLKSLTLWPYPLEEFVRMVCARCGVEMMGEDLPNGVFPIRKFTASEVTGRKLISWAAQIMGTFCQATESGMLTFAWYTPTDTAICSQKGENAAAFFAGTLSYSDFCVAPVDGVALPGGIVYPEAGGENVFTVSANPYLTGTAADLPVAERLYSALSRLSYTPASVTVPAGIFHPGELVSVTDGAGKVFTMPIMTAVRSGQRETLSATGSQSRQSIAPQSVESLTGKVQALQTEIGNLKGVDVTPALEEISAQLALQRGKAEVLREQLLCMEQAERDSLPVLPMGETVLADEADVEAKKARIASLTVGSHSLFSDYEGGTGCFYF